MANRHHNPWSHRRHTRVADVVVCSATIYVLAWLAELDSILQLRDRRRHLLPLLDVNGRRLWAVNWKDGYENKSYAAGRQTRGHGACCFGKRGKSVLAAFGLPARLDIVPEKETENLQLHLRNNSNKRNLKEHQTEAYKNEMGDRGIFTKIVGTPMDFDVSIGFGERIKNIQSLQSTFEKIPLQVKLLLGEPVLEKNFWNYVTTQADLKRNTYGLSKTNVSEFPQIWREREIVREIEVIYCKYCGAKNNARRTSCTQCGANLR